MEAIGACWSWIHNWPVVVYTHHQWCANLIMYICKSKYMGFSSVISPWMHPQMFSISDLIKRHPAFMLVRVNAFITDSSLYDYFNYQVLSNMRIRALRISESEYIEFCSFVFNRRSFPWSFEIVFSLNVAQWGPAVLMQQTRRRRRIARNIAHLGLNHCDLMMPYVDVNMDKLGLLPKAIT